MLFILSTGKDQKKILPLNSLSLNVIDTQKLTRPDQFFRIIGIQRVLIVRYIEAKVTSLSDRIIRNPI